MTLPASDADARFERSIDRWFRDRMRLEPALASFVGIHEHDGRLPIASLEAILAAARSERCPDALLSRLSSAVIATRQALEDHGTWLRTDVLPRAAADWRAGPEQFEEIVRLRELMANGDEILAVGEQILADERTARAATSQELDPTLSPEEVADLVKNDHPATFGEALEEYRRSMDAARRFVIDHDLATMPADDTLVVIETPSYLRH